ncbi:hypothetical protein CRG98_004384 [Punica granatum]|uniref:Reverse transcriptase Ty1/copia-type domain-containing protein n=1 Tax=Punica granatum TaxID=22663 RepID=A0A2I0L3M6_PUNGR|nr:hypothetical protein CRG98_004384 [Punica granatum]
MSTLYANGTWELVSLPPRKTVVGCRWVYTVKMSPNGYYGDTFSLVAKVASVRLLLSLAVINHWSLNELDIKNAFLHGDLEEEVYMEQPPWFVAQGEYFGKVCKLRKSLYGLKQFPRAWFGCFNLGALKYFLGIEVAQSERGIYISQRKYLLNILKETKLLECKPVDTPMDPNVRLALGEGELFLDVGRYRRLVDSPTETYWNAVIQILKYFKAAPSRGLLYQDRGHNEVVRYTDTDWAGSKSDRRSTTGYCVVLHITSNPIFHEKAKHIEVDCHFVREKLQSQDIVTAFVSSNDQLADIFTKALQDYICNKLGIHNIYAPA